MSETRLDDQHAAHLEGLEHAYARLLEAHGYEGVLLYSGAPRHFFGDDQQASFATFAHFLHWVPLAGIEHSWLLIRPGQRPLLRFHAPVDFWHLTPSLPQAAWTRRFTLEASAETAPPPLPQGRLAIVGDVDAGDAIIFDSRTQHAGGANRSQRTRPVLYLVFARPWFDEAMHRRLVVGGDGGGDRAAKLFPEFSASDGA